MLQGVGDYRIERWLAGEIPLVTVRSSSALGALPAVVVYHGFAGSGPAIEDERTVTSGVPPASQRSIL